MRTKIAAKRKARPGRIDRAIAVTNFPRGDKTELARTVSRYLADRSPSVRGAALEVVRDERLRELEVAVLRLLADKNSFVRYTAAECLGFLYERKAIRATWLYPLLEDDAFLVRIETLESLVQIGDKKALPLIAKRLQDGDVLVRSYAAWAIGELKGRKYMKALTRALKVEKEDRAIVGFAGALFALGDAAQLPVLLELLSSADYHVRCASANTLSDLEFNSDQIQSILAALGHAAAHSLHVADRSNMETVERELQAQE